MRFRFATVERVMKANETAKPGWFANPHQPTISHCLTREAQIKVRLDSKSMADGALAKQTPFWNLGCFSLCFNHARTRFHAPSASITDACAFRLRRPFFLATFFGRAKKVAIIDIPILSRSSRNRTPHVCRTFRRVVVTFFVTKERNQRKSLRNRGPQAMFNQS
jgi:hypothetical protein